MIKLTSAYKIQTASQILFMMLEQRDQIASISHKEMPTLKQHNTFFESRPYKSWWLIEIFEAGNPDFIIGNAYITKENEVGMFLMDHYQGKGYGKTVLDLIKDEVEGKLLANIAPENVRSQKFFEREGFKLIQITYELAR